MSDARKTCALRVARQLSDINSRFSGSTFFVSMGSDDGLGRLIGMVAEMVRESERHNRAKNV